MADAPLKWVEVPEAQDLWEGDLVDAEVDGEQVLIVHHLDGSFAAYQGLCPHQEVLLADGKWDEESATLECSGHAWQFDMRSGEGINPAGCRLYQFPVEVTDGIVRIGIPQDELVHYNRYQEA
ncbi:Rieske 2Fe-2S domain-containing protein [Mycobacterium helveticum]|uniref:Rieske 2Fe-2S domain-containing protein n=1 Tax=Mycobacterium helveticum TaxID=2592811 RepID=A0A557XVY9_9MYCO|nr:Rieske 2Fe-2S domain-containing protein [Mycobacterium helveticum]TVS86175.1 Rieske 2Fe-2S domain-containing protein [Mycobacterium helveticum]TVS90194.1 Rieske 2Fe-2S domain-containing protein [Mycobacterium helveticum]